MFGEFCKVCLLLRIKPLTSVRGCFTEVAGDGECEILHVLEGPPPAEIK